MLLLKIEFRPKLLSIPTSTMVRFLFSFFFFFRVVFFASDVCLETSDIFAVVGRRWHALFVKNVCAHNQHIHMERECNVMTTKLYPTMCVCDFCSHDGAITLAMTVDCVSPYMQYTRQFHIATLSVGRSSNLGLFPISYCIWNIYTQLIFSLSPFLLSSTTRLRTAHHAHFQKRSEASHVSTMRECQCERK